MSNEHGKFDWHNLAGVFAIFGMLCLVVVAVGAPTAYLTMSEIDEGHYGWCERWIKYPSVRPLVEAAMEDGKITGWEYHCIMMEVSRAQARDDVGDKQRFEKLLRSNQ